MDNLHSVSIQLQKKVQMNSDQDQDLSTEVVFQTKSVCCTSHCTYPVGKQSSLEVCAPSTDDVWLLGVASKTYPCHPHVRVGASAGVKAFIFREVLPDGTVGAPFRCWFYGECARRAQEDISLGDTVCFFRPDASQWKESSVGGEESRFVVLVREVGRTRVVVFRLTGRPGCAACRRDGAAPADDAESAPGRRTGGGRARRRRGPPTGIFGSASDAGGGTAAGRRRSGRRSPGASGGQPPKVRRLFTQPSRLALRLEEQPSGEASAGPTAGGRDPADPPTASDARNRAGSSPESGRPAAAGAGPTPQTRPASVAAASDAEPQDAPAPTATDFMARVPASAPDDRYTLVADVGRGDPALRQRPSVMAVIVAVPQPLRPTARGFMTMAAVKDPSCCTADPARFDLMVFAFTQTIGELPQLEPNHGLQVGNILRARHLKIENHNGKLDGRVFRGSALTVFSSTVGDPLAPLGCDDAEPTVTDADRARLVWLREWWAQQRERQERLGSATDASLGQIVRLGLYNVRFQVLSLRADAGRVAYLHVQDGTRCPLPIREPRPPADGDDPAETQESDTQVFRDLAYSVHVQVSDRRCLDALTTLRANGHLDFVQVLRMRVTNELQDEATYSTGLQLSLVPDDEPLVVRLDPGSTGAAEIRQRLAEVPESRPAGEPEPSSQPSAAQGPDSGAAGRPESAGQRPAAQTRGGRTEDRPEPPPAPAAPAVATPRRSLRQGPAARQETAAAPGRPPRPARGMVLRARETPASCQQSPESPAGRAASQLQSQRTDGISRDDASCPSYQVARERLGLPESSSQGSAEPSDCGFTTAPQSPAAAAAPPAAGGASTRVTDLRLPLVPFSEVAARPAGEPFRTRCVVRLEGRPAEGRLVELLAATCPAPGCLTQYVGAALPPMRLAADLTPTHFCRACGGPMPLHLALPLRLSAATADRRTLPALVTGEPAERFVGVAVRPATLAALPARLRAVDAALAAAPPGEVGLLPLGESDRRFLVVDTEVLA